MTQVLYAHMNNKTIKIKKKRKLRIFRNTLSQEYREDGTSQMTSKMISY
jgi:hypothetical protein